MLTAQALYAITVPLLGTDPQSPDEFKPMSARVCDEKTYAKLNMQMTYVTSTDGSKNSQFAVWDCLFCQNITCNRKGCFCNIKTGT